MLDYFMLFWFLLFALSGISFAIVKTWQKIERLGK